VTVGKLPISACHLPQQMIAALCFLEITTSRKRCCSRLPLAPSFQPTRPSYCPSLRGFQVVRERVGIEGFPPL
jgi:hypothetical protein